MSETIDDAPSVRKLPLAAAFIALIGLFDAVYLTIHHFTAVPVPCTIVGGCETVLTSSYAEIGGVPIALFGGLSYFTAFSLAILAAFGNRMAWTMFSVLVVLMAGFSLWLIYLQAFVIGAYCQFCLLSAGVTFTLLAIAIASFILAKR